MTFVISVLFLPWFTQISLEKEAIEAQLKKHMSIRRRLNTYRKYPNKKGDKSI